MIKPQIFSVKNTGIPTGIYVTFPVYRLAQSFSREFTTWFKFSIQIIYLE